MRLAILILLLVAQVDIPFPGSPPIATNAFPSISNLQLRLEADCVTSGPCANPSDGTTVSTWVDQSGNSRTLTMVAGTCTLHTNQINSLPAVTFASGCRGNLASSIAWVSGSSGGITEFVVLSLSSTSAVAVIASGTVSNTFVYAFAKCYNDSSNAEQSAGLDENQGVGCGTATATTTFHQMNVTAKDLTNPIFRLDRASDATRLGAGGTFAGAITAVGADVQGGINFPFPGQLSFLAVYNRILTGPEITQVETYLHTKYGL